MKSQETGLRVASVIFGFMSLGQLVRLITGLEIAVAGYHIPLWPSFLAFPVLACLCVWLWKLSCLSGK